ncbi:MAG: hypothetical protein ACYYKD_00405 [Rhodospirillales bacterium]
MNKHVGNIVIDHSCEWARLSAKHGFKRVRRDVDSRPWRGFPVQAASG